MVGKLAVAWMALVPLSSFFIVAEAEDAQAFATRMRTAQFKNVPPPSPPPSIPPSLGPTLKPYAPSFTPAPTPNLTPSAPLTPSQPPLTASPPGSGGPPPPIAAPRPRVPPGCVVTSTDGWAGSGCPNRYIYYSDLVRRLRACTDHDARCFAARIIELARQPTVVVYPQPAAAARAIIEKELAYAIDVMGNHLKGRVYGGAPNLPSISAINNMVDRAKRAVDAINLPLDETPEEQLRRLGLTPDMVGLATSVLNS